MGSAACRMGVCQLIAREPLSGGLANLAAWSLGLKSTPPAQWSPVATGWARMSRIAMWGEAESSAAASWQRSELNARVRSRDGQFLKLHTRSRCCRNGRDWETWR